MFSAERKLSRLGNLGLTWVLAFLLGDGLIAQTRVTIQVNGDSVPVVAMDGNVPMVQVGQQRFRVTEGSLKVEDTFAFTDGAIDVLSRNAIMGQDYGSTMGSFFFHFRADVIAERDFEDCFILFVISPEEGGETQVIHEIADIDSVGVEKVALTIPINPGFGGGSFGYKLFSKGEEIRLREPDDPIFISEVGKDSDASSPGSNPVARSRGAGVESTEPARILDGRLLEFPRQLEGTIKGGYATAVFTLDEIGRVIELIDLRVDHPAFAPEVMNCILGSRFAAGLYQGKPIVTTVEQSFFFNEFAPFAEALRTVPYPKLGDRNARAIYVTPPRFAVDQRIETHVEVLVNTLGQVVEIYSEPGTEYPVKEAVKDAVLDWQFVPAIVDGYPAAQRIKLPFVFKDQGIVE